MTDRGRMVGWRAAMIAACVAGGHVAHAQAPDRSRAAEIFGADVVIEEAIVNAEGAVVEARPTTRYRLSRRRVEGGVETEIAYPAARLFAKGPLADPRSGLRYVFGAAGTGTRIYDASGTLVAHLDDAPPADAADVGAVVFADRDLRAREAALRRRLGRPVGRLGASDRYVAHDAEATTETLVAADTMLPVEINRVRAGALEQRSSLSYARMPGGRWYLARSRSETALTDGSGRRFVSTRLQINVSGTEGR